MREFSADYLDRTRRGMWADSRAALADLSLSSRQRVLDVGCGTGELTAVLAEETGGTVVGVDADTELLTTARDRSRDGIDGYAAGDAVRLPFAADSFDLVVCQALLVNLPEPPAALREFARVSRDLVAAVEPDNADVAVSSTVETEASLEAEARAAFVDGVATDVTTADLTETFAAAGLSAVSTRRYHHEKRVTPPYSETDLEGATRKATGAALASHETELRRALSPTAYDDLRQRWRAMGRDVVEQMQTDDYERVEVVPFDVTVGRV
ncbi:class I SAM-dependent methyltransferase [Halobaculum sp. MBLA0143]|uniref:class I SAM-dependent methyltransferase n=1 Tax=Halobaculum sp. MBLA0143 TaxID=3079933 RepID=UPI0035255F00